MVEKTYKPHKYQAEFHKSDARFRLLIAGRRGGKSIAGTIEALYQSEWMAKAKERPVKGWIIAPTYPMLKDVNIPMIMDWLPQKSIKEWNKQEHRLTLINGSEIVFRSGEDPEKLRGVGLDWLWLDEACFMQKAVWDTIYPALTDKNGIAWITTSPQGYDWVHNTFYKTAKEGSEDYAAWQYRTIDNPYIDSTMVDKARKEMTEVMFRQEYLASFEKLTGLVYPDFDEKDHVVDSLEGDRDDLFFVGIDVGYTNPTAATLIRETADHTLYVVDEYYETGKTVKEAAEGIKAMVGNKKIEMYIIDPASKSTHQETGNDVSVEQLFHENGIPVIPGNNDVRAGIDYVTQLLRRDEFTKKPRLMVLGKCKNVIREFQNYSWPKYKEGSLGNKREKPEKAFDHSLDSIRYVVMSRPDWFERVQRDQSGRLVMEKGNILNDGDDNWDSDDFEIDNMEDYEKEVL